MNWFERAKAIRNFPRLKARLSCIAAYGDRCACCGETNAGFLIVCDSDNKAVNTNVYFKLRRENFPTGYRVLCYNCHMHIKVYGACQHSPLWTPLSARAILFGTASR